MRNDVTEKWDLRFLSVAKLIASWSKDPSTKVGAVIVGANREIRATGYNGPPRRVDDDVVSRWSRPAKYEFVSHAEENAICNACLSGIALAGCTIYVWPCPPCSACARQIIQSGLNRIVTTTVVVPERHRVSFSAAKQMLGEANVEITYVDLI